MFENIPVIMLKLIRISIIVFVSNTSVAQWQWTELSNMPFESANNALCEASPATVSVILFVNFEY